MKKALFSLITLLFATVAALTTIRHSPVEACPSTNDLVADDLGATSQPDLHFFCTLRLLEWHLTFDPLVLNLSPQGTGDAEVQNVQYNPASILVQHEGCEFGPQDQHPEDEPYEIFVSGDLTGFCRQGNVNTKVLLSAGGTTFYSEPWATFVPPVCDATCPEMCP